MILFRIVPSLFLFLSLNSLATDFITILDEFLAQNETEEYFLTTGLSNGKHSFVALIRNSTLCSSEESSLLSEKSSEEESSSPSKKQYYFPKRHRCEPWRQRNEDLILDECSKQLEDIFHTRTSPGQPSLYPVAVIYCPSGQALVIKKTTAGYKKIPVHFQKPLLETHSRHVPTLLGTSKDKSSPKNLKFTQRPMPPYKILEKLYLLSIEPFDRGGETGFDTHLLSLVNIPIIFMEESHSFLVHGLHLRKSTTGGIAFTPDGLLGLAGFGPEQISWSHLTENDLEGITKLGWPLTPFENGYAVFSCNNMCLISQIPTLE